MGQLPWLLFLLTTQFVNSSTLTLASIGFWTNRQQVGWGWTLHGYRMVAYNKSKSKLQGGFYTQPGWPAFANRRCGIIAPCYHCQDESSGNDQSKHCINPVKASLTTLQVGRTIGWKWTLPGTPESQPLLYGYPRMWVDPGATTTSGPSIAGDYLNCHITPHIAWLLTNPARQKVTGKMASPPTLPMLWCKWMENRIYGILE